VLTPAPPHIVPAGPLAVRWLAYDVPTQRAGAVSMARLELENAGSVRWQSPGRGQGIHVAYHWLDPLRNPIVWSPAYTPLGAALEPGDRAEIVVPVRAAIPPGPYRLAFDLVDSGRLWFSDVGNERLELDVRVEPRIERALAVEIAPGLPGLVERTRTALARQQEPVVTHGAATAFLVAGCVPAVDWSSRILSAHEEGWAAVGGSIDVKNTGFRRRHPELDPWRPGFGRAPNWPGPLLCPSLANEVLHVVTWPEPLRGLPRLDTDCFPEPWLCDGRIRLAVDATALRPVDRPRA
jgi:hypothetical protein